MPTITLKYHHEFQHQAVGRDQVAKAMEPTQTRTMSITWLQHDAGLIQYTNQQQRTYPSSCRIRRFRDLITTYFDARVILKNMA